MRVLYKYKLAFQLAIWVFILMILASCRNPLVQVILNDIASDSIVEQYPQIVVRQGNTTIDNESGMYDFGSIDQQVETEVIEFIIENAGDGNLFLNGDPKVSVLGNDSLMFNIKNQPLSPVYPQESTTFSASFQPTTSGTKNGTISIYSTDPEVQEFTFSVTGYGRIGDIQISDDIGSVNGSHLCWNGSGYGVFWGDSRYSNNEIFFQGIDSLGNKTTPNIRLTNAADTSLGVTAAWNGSEYGVTWHDRRDGGSEEIYFCRLSVVGNKISSDIRITNSAGYSMGPRICWNGSEYGIVWFDDRDGNNEIYFTRVSAAGVEQGDDVRITNDSAYSSQPRIAWMGSEYGIVFGDQRDGDSEIYFTRVSSTGVKQGAEIKLTDTAERCGDPFLCWNGIEYGLVWSDDRYSNPEIFFARVDSLGNKIGSDIRITNDSASSEVPTLSWAGENYGLVWCDDRDRGNLEYEIYFKALSRYGDTESEDIRVTDADGTSIAPYSVWTGEDFGIIWDDTRAGGYETYFTRLNATGEKY